MSHRHCRAVWDSIASFELESQIVSVVSRDGLITMKEISGRDQDLVDIRKLRGDDDD